MGYKVYVAGERLWLPGLRPGTGWWRIRGGNVGATWLPVADPERGGGGLQTRHNVGVYVGVNVGAIRVRLSPLASPAAYFLNS